MGDSGDGFAFWKMPMPGLDELGDPATEEEAAAARRKAAETEIVPRSPPAVAWPPVSPAALAEPDSKVGTSTAPASGKASGRGNRRKDGGGGKGSEKGSGGGGGGGGGQKRDDGWLPKAEYEAKKREERARRQREKEHQQQQTGSGDKWGSGTTAAGAGAAGGAGAVAGDAQGRRGGRGRRDNTWQDVMVNIPKRPDPIEETPEMRAKRETEEARLQCRDRLRAAATAADLREAIAAAKELGLSDEVRLAERKLAKMEGGASA